MARSGTAAIRANTALERQIHNWYHYIWLSGDHICEQHVHNLDVCNWVMNDHPVKCWGQGSRQQLGDKPGEIWDNFDVEYDYSTGRACSAIAAKSSAAAPQASSEFVHGTKEPPSPAETSHPKSGQRWRSSLKVDSGNPYVQEHVDLINADLQRPDLNETKNVTDSTLTAIMGREAAYSGGWVEWDDILNSTFQYGSEQVYEHCDQMSSASSGL